MKLSPSEAARALYEVDSSRDRTRQSLGRSTSSRFLVLWGSAWIAASILAALIPSRGGLVWDALMSGAGSVSVYWAFRMRRFLDALDQAAGVRRYHGLKYLATVLVSIAVLAALIGVARPVSSPQLTAIIVLAVSEAYLLAGIWRDTRYLAPGVILAALTLAGYFQVIPGFLVWIGIASGAVLVVSGIWFRRA
ncbi:MAG: hypothetical protein ACREUT_13155 [Steroidobacteraceae bacterium]